MRIVNWLRVEGWQRNKERHTFKLWDLGGGRVDQAAFPPEDASYFNQLQTHCKNLKCVGLSATDSDFVFKIAFASSNILVSRAGLVAGGFLG
jgi:hypothetical protein